MLFIRKFDLDMSILFSLKMIGNDNKERMREFVQHQLKQPQFVFVSNNSLNVISADLTKPL